MKNNNLNFCEKILDTHPKGFRDERTGIVYDNATVFTKELGCYNCADMWKCIFANNILDILKKKYDNE